MKIKWLAIVGVFLIFLSLISIRKEDTKSIKTPIPASTSELKPKGPEATPSSAEGNPQKAAKSQIGEDLVLVKRVVDGDTIEIEGGQKVRYIGIDSPETQDSNRQVGCYSREASNRNKELVEGKKVRLEKDVSETDKFGRLLRYLWMGDILINELLVREGYAKSSTYPPDVKYQEKFLAAERKAREEEKGLWSRVCLASTSSESISPKIAPSPTPATSSPPPEATSESFTCNCSKTCEQMSSCEEAYYQLRNCGCSKRDGDSDGVPCEKICSGG